jgi:hypothetical protein
MKKTIKYVLFCGIGVLLGIIADRNKEYLINSEFIKDHWSSRENIADKDKVVNADKVMIVLAFGQSNSADYGAGEYVCRNKEIYNYCKGNLYRAKEPLLGADGTGTSVWTRVADMLIDSGIYKKVIIVPCGIGSTSVQCWAEGGCKIQLQKTLDYLKKDNIKLTQIFWDQGETDNVDKTTKIEYKTRLKTIIKFIRDQHVDAPFFSSITSYCSFGNDNPMGIDTNITQAQYEVIREVNNVKQGPNTDSLNLAYYRFDYLHFTEKGLDKLAYGWYKSIKAAK